METVLGHVPRPTTNACSNREQPCVLRVAEYDPSREGARRFCRCGHPPGTASQVAETTSGCAVRVIVVVREARLRAEWHLQSINPFASERLRWQTSGDAKHQSCGLHLSRMTPSCCSRKHYFTVFLTRRTAIYSSRPSCHCSCRVGGVLRWGVLRGLGKGCWCHRF